ncbi:hypothetical protein GCM10023144_10370 [Pigmentiphaga soli]|uniref:3-carboxymuconate cyclase n=1 Tax=Pigmentiphaga soli TaxID=1007095 RepID=A0ABP8GLM9_9BURK
MTGATFFYASLGAELICFHVDEGSGELRRQASITLPGSVQYAWPHATGSHLYVASSDGGPPAAGGCGGSNHHLGALRIDPSSGRLSPEGAPVVLRHRPIHLSTDIPSEYALIAYSEPSALSVHEIRADGSLGREVAQPDVRDCGSYAHQIRVFPSNRRAVLVTRGHDADADHAEVPGALKTFGYEKGVLTPERSIAPDGGYGFGPRHLDFHPRHPWVYLSLERQNQLQLFRMSGEDLDERPAGSVPTLARPDRKGPRQMAGAVHVHPGGRHVYGAERSDPVRLENSVPVCVPGENAILVFAIDPADGRPSLVQREPTRGLHPRTFSIHPEGRLLIAANKSSALVKTAGQLHQVHGGFDIFRIDSDGRLAFLRSYPIDASQLPIFWSGFVRVQAARPQRETT